MVSLRPNFAAHNRILNRMRRISERFPAKAFPALGLRDGCRRQKNASKQKIEPPFRFNRNEKALIERGARRPQFCHLLNRYVKFFRTERRKRADAVAAGERRWLPEIGIFDVGI